MYVIMSACVDNVYFSQYNEKAAVEKYISSTVEECKESKTELIFCQGVDEFNHENLRDGEQIVLIIEGKIIVPKPEKVITKYII